MPSFSTISAAAVLAFAGMCSAIPQYNFGNGTASAVASGRPMTSSVSGRPMTTSAGRPSANSTSSAVAGRPSSNATTPALDGKFCPGLDLSLYIDNSGATFRIECDTNHFGTIIDIQVNITRRAVPSSLDDCLNLCDATATCVGTAFDTNARTCTLYSDVQAAYDAAGIQFAQRVAAGTGNNGGNGGNGNGMTTIPAGGVATSTIYSTNVVTISSCAPTVTNCPLKNGQNAVVTQIIPVASTTYVCPAQTTLPVAPIACTSCPYTVSTATVYSATGGNMVPVSTQVYAAPCPTGTVVVEKVCTACAAMTSTVPAGNTQTVTACNGANCPATSTMAKYTPTTSGMVMYTGAASNVKAGMGFAAMVAGAALVL
ncbi:hypothetical protein D6D19_08846 [Aureobasidium pullulans]|uniref:Apple domain-containing protein n=1 Tax=Aureobasidium pullulans TaxID=5580 RepID=A0A4S8ZR21_AURPU|nr:hypothetical protein D6D19_08846 [Aureobasidium pullulans]